MQCHQSVDIEFGPTRWQRSSDPTLCTYWERVGLCSIVPMRAIAMFAKFSCRLSHSSGGRVFQLLPKANAKPKQSVLHG